MKILNGVFTLIILSLAFNVFAQTRFTQKEKDEFIQELRKDIKEYKDETKKVFKASVLKDELFKRIADLRNEKAISYHEERKIIDRYNDLIAQATVKKNIDEEKALFEIMDQELKIIDSRILQCVSEGNVCNDVGCCDGLTCAIEPKKSVGNKCASTGNSCAKDGDCCSGECELNASTNKKTCREIKRCYRAQSAGARCNDNPVCAQGICASFDTETSGYAVGLDNNLKCKQDKECRSNFCQSGTCSEQRVCKECTKLGNKLERGLKCCEGLMPNSAGRCIPDAPPIVLPQVNIMNKSKGFIVSMVLALIPSSYAADADSNAMAQIQQIQNKEESDKDANMANQLSADSKSKVYADPLKKQHTDAKYKTYTKSDFASCAIDFKSDYYNYMMSKNIGENNQDAMTSATMFDYNSALLAFEYMSLGEENYDDFWLSSKDSSGASIHKRLKNVSLMSQKSRNDVEKKLIEYNRKLTCLCLDTMGPKGIGFESEIANLVKYKAEIKDGKNASLPALSQPVLKILCGGETKDPICGKYQLENKVVGDFKEYKDSLIKGKDKVAYYADYCEEERNAYAALIRDIDSSAGAESIADDGGGDASGIKGTRMLVYWTKTLQDFTMELSVDNTSLFGKFVDVHSWYEKQTSEDLWSQARIDKADLFNFDVQDNHNHRVYSMAAAIIAATLAIGVITVIGGASVASVITTWSSLGVIAIASIAGGGGGYVVASLRGAWIGKSPFIEDKKIRTYDCGSKKNPKTCTTYTRSYKYPVSEICNAKVSSNACIKHFLVTKDDASNDVYIVDPWIPVGITKREIIKDDKTLVSRISDSFGEGVGVLSSRAPGGRQSEDYRINSFLTSSYTGYFAPKFLPNYVETYTVTPPMKELIKKKAKEYAISQNFFDKTEAEQLESFAQYAYDYHFVWAKSSAAEIIAYPQPAFLTYLDMMSAGVAGKLAVGNAENSTALRKLNNKYISTYKKLLSTFRDKAVSGDRSKMVEWANKELKAIEAMETQNMLIDKALGAGGNLTAVAPNGSALQGASIGGSDGSSGLSGNAAAFVSSVKKLRGAREDQIKKLNEFKKNLGDSDRGKALLASQKMTLAKFSSPSKSSLGSTGRNLFNSGSANNSSGTNDSSTSNSGSGYDGSLNNVGAQGLDSGSGLSGYGSSSRYTKSSSSSDPQSGNGLTSAVGSDDEKRIEGALDAMDKNGGKGVYQSSDEDNLWERITKTYIRNYDKVLIKRKSDKDLPANRD